ncbi:hypothetical protein [Petrachloros mirabilis]
MGQLAKKMGAWKGTKGAAASLEKAAYRLAKALFEFADPDARVQIAGCMWETAQAEADAACHKYASAVARATSTGGNELIPAIVADPKNMTVTVLDYNTTDAEPIVRLTITPETLDQR